MKILTNKITVGAFCFAMVFLVSCGEKMAPLKSLSDRGPIQLHPENPHYFLYKGKALALITSAEHYGAVLNRDFDYKTYLETLSADGMNYTRIFTGSYFERPGDFGIQYNTLAPKNNGALVPWVKSTNSSENPEYDLSKFDPTYFERLKGFLAAAEKRDIIVEITLFSSIYQDGNWKITPLNPKNNINIKQKIDRHDAQTLNNGELLGYQENFVKKIVKETNGFDNFFIEIQNEPWSDHPLPVYKIQNKELSADDDWTVKATFADSASIAWQDHMINVITDMEANLPKKHLIAQNYTNFKAPIPYVNDRVSILNFHYAWPEAVRWNYGHDRVLGFDESGFAGSDNRTYRRQAWQFMLSGGGLFNNLDYSFYVGYEDGLGENKAPGGGSKALRRQLRILSDFLAGFPLEKMRPDTGSLLSSPGLIPFVLSDGDGNYAVFLRAVATSKSTITLRGERPVYHVQTLNTTTGTYSEPIEIRPKKGMLNIDIDIPQGEIALKITG